MVLSSQLRCLSQLQAVCLCWRQGKGRKRWSHPYLFPFYQESQNFPGSSNRVLLLSPLLALSPSTPSCKGDWEIKITLFQTLQWIREGEKKVEKGVRLGSQQWQPPVHVILMKTLPNVYCDVSPFYKWETKTWRSYENWPRSNNWKMREQGSTQVVCLQSLFTSQPPHYSVETKPQADSTQCLPVWVVFFLAFSRMTHCLL